MGSCCIVDNRLLRIVLQLVGTAVLAFSYAFAVASAGCAYPAIFSFGTSVSDTGNTAHNLIGNYTIQSPYGETYFGRPAKRFSDGRLMIDFLAQAVGLPFLNSYLDYRYANGTDFSKGVNYAVAGATVIPPIQLLTIADFAYLSYDSLEVQMRWHLAFKQAAELTPGSPTPYPGVTLPSPSAFADGLYFMEMGGNDYGSYYLSGLILPGRRKKPINNAYAISTLMPKVVQSMLNSIETLYANSARNFIILSLFPAGCDPLFLRYINGTKDDLGCLTTIDEVDTAHNQRLLGGLEGLRRKYPDINLMYADTNGALVRALRNPATYGFKEIINACCGIGPSAPYGFAITRLCGPKSYNCIDSSSHVVWDGIHNTDHMNQYLINSLTLGGYLNPSNGLECASRV